MMSKGREREIFISRSSPYRNSIILTFVTPHSRVGLESEVGVKKVVSLAFRVQ
jgi:hypothetical protein